MEFRKMVTITLYMRQQKRHWCIEQSFGLCGRVRGWDDLGEWHWNMYNIIYETSRQSRFDARYWMLGAGALGRPRGMVWGVRREEGSGWGTHVYLWQIHFDIWQNQYDIVKLKKIKLKKRKTKGEWLWKLNGIRPRKCWAQSLAPEKYSINVYYCCCCFVFVIKLWTHSSCIWLIVNPSTGFGKQLFKGDLIVSEENTLYGLHSGPRTSNKGRTNNGGPR